MWGKRKGRQSMVTSWILFTSSISMDGHKRSSLNPPFKIKLGKKLWKNIIAVRREENPPQSLRLLSFSLFSAVKYLSSLPWIRRKPNLFGWKNQLSYHPPEVSQENPRLRLIYASESWGFFSSGCRLMLRLEGREWGFFRVLGFLGTGISSPEGFLVSGEIAWECSPSRRRRE